MTDQEIDAWFHVYVVHYMFADLAKSINANVNYGVALMLVSYTEILGGLRTGDLGTVGNSCSDFQAGLILLDAGLQTVEPSAPKDFYASYRVELDGKPTGLYKVLRCGLVHEYFTKGKAWIANAPTNAGSGKRAVGWQNFGNGKDEFYVNVNAYFEHLKLAAASLNNLIKADSVIRRNFQTALQRLDSRTLKQVP